MSEASDTKTPTDPARRGVMTGWGGRRGVLRDPFGLGCAVNEPAA